MTISLTQARKLQSLGVDKFAEKSWWSNPVQTDEPFLDSCNADVDACYLLHIAQAYNAEELLGMLKGDLEIYRFEGECTVSTAVNHSNPSQDCTTFYGATLTEALGNKLIYDLENGIITAEEANR